MHWKQEIQESCMIWETEKPVFGVFLDEIQGTSWSQYDLSQNLSNCNMHFKVG